jgi:hypothetical protein
VDRVRQIALELHPVGALKIFDGLLPDFDLIVGQVIGLNNHDGTMPQAFCACNQGYGE